LPAYVKTVAGGVELSVKVVPGASRSRIVGPLGDALKIQVAAPPERGRANAAVVELLAEALGVALKQVVVVQGTSSPRKTLRISGVSVNTVVGKLNSK
jgi:hypothetical protein